MVENDTIAAIAAGMGNSGIGIIRISGKDAFSVADRVFYPRKKGKLLSRQETYTIHYGNIVDGEEILDEAIVLLMRGPHSYTAEDTVEIDCHGGAYVTQRILDLIIQNGARPALPGEFTKRAFLNGRIDLSQAEAVMDVIQARNEYALRSSVRQLKGSLLRKIKGIREKVIYEAAFIESALDDPEHIDLSGYPQQLRVKVENLLEESKELLTSANQGRILREGIRTVLLGKPNAGKSSLLNILVGEDRAIVTDIAGTTRDVLEEQVRLGGLCLDILDTAGIRASKDLIEQIGVEKAKRMAQDADLILYVVDSSNKLDENDEEIISLLQDRNVIVLLNKIDLAVMTDTDTVRGRLKKPVVPVSAKEGTGIDDLQSLLEKMFLSEGNFYPEEAYLANARQKAAMEEARDSLERVLESIDAGMPEDFFSIDLMDAYEALGRILGESLEEDLIDEIFGRFCTGK